MKKILLVLVLMLGMGGGTGAKAGLFGPSNFQTCILDHMAGTASDFSARVIASDCYRAYGNSSAAAHVPQELFTAYRSGDACFEDKGKITGSELGAQLLYGACHWIYDPAPPPPSTCRSSRSNDQIILVPVSAVCTRQRPRPAVERRRTRPDTPWPELTRPGRNLARSVARKSAAPPRAGCGRAGPRRGESVWREHRVMNRCATCETAHRSRKSFTLRALETADGSGTWRYGPNHVSGL